MGLRPKGGINWDAPLISKYRIETLPYFAVVDETGKLIAQGDAAQRMIGPWMNEDEE
ncbi:MAG: hypothetical protein HY815_20930 [Candidatus Riflebacteria bacterium]|nr:hypothetical protein [Candidatus Riflebacteria bacterium]